MLDLLFKGGWVVDGLGTPMYRADVGVAEGKIRAVGILEGAEAVRTLDCAGLCVSPGWVDIQSALLVGGTQAASHNRSNFPAITAPRMTSISSAPSRDQRMPAPVKRLLNCFTPLSTVPEPMG